MAGTQTPNPHITNGKTDNLRPLPRSRMDFDIITFAISRCGFGVYCTWEKFGHIKILIKAFQMPISIVMCTVEYKNTSTIIL